MGRSDAARDGRRTRAARALCCALAVAALIATGLGVGGCASAPPKRAAPYYHEVAPGENLYRIGLRYGVPAAEIARVNGIHDVTELSVGQRLLIPGLRGSAIEPSRRTPRYAGPLRFTWPVKGRLTSRFGLRGNRPHEGIDLGAPHGTPIFAAEAGRVIHSGRFGAYGKVVILKHAGAYRSVYAHARQLFVEKGDFVERGQKIAEVGATGRATGPHLHFEIRRGETAHDPLVYLP
ncbi:MAG: LysM peptidoglycan-binding domain-containing M23 family metallopeptidase [Deltaproteobacteria bacterium]|nr:LysM peptidoglycan-binding domain-containing M23 family metallopeptidase [Deltaproteobacteria bacterium]